MTRVLADCRYALRGLRKSPVFAGVAILSIALGIGANTAIFTLLDQVLLRLLPVENPQELVLLRGQGPFSGSWRGDENVLSYPTYADIRDHNQVFAGTFARFSLPVHVGFDRRTERTTGELVSGTYFRVLGVRAALGRTIAEDDDARPGAHPVAVLSFSYWKSRFGGDPQIIGKKITLNDQPMTIIGVLQAGFDGVDIGDATRVYVPLMMKAQMTPQWNHLDDRRSRWVHIFGRLKPGVRVEQATASLQPYYTSLLELELQQPALADAPARFRSRYAKEGKIELRPGSQGRTGVRDDLQTPLWVLMGIVGGVLLIACANVANLLLARAAARQREIAIRLALGASRLRIVQQLLIESLVLAGLGGVLGLALATLGARALLAFFVGEDSGLVVTAAPDLRVLAFNAAVSLVTGVIFGIAPALRSTRPALATTLKDQAGSVVGGGQVRLRKTLVVAQVALSLLLLIGAGLFIRSLTGLMTLDPGFKTENLVAFSVDPALNGYAPERRKQFFRELQERLGSAPGVSSAGFAAVGILQGDQWRSTIQVEGYQPKPDEDMNPNVNSVSPGYFATMDMRLLAGRDFDVRDQRTGPAAATERDGPPEYRVAIVNESFVKMHLKGQNPIGRHIGFGRPEGPKPVEIVGVVKDAKYVNMRDEIPRQVFFPFFEEEDPGSVTMYVRTARQPDAIFGTVRQVVQQLDPNLPIYALRTLEYQLQRSLTNERLVASLSTVFGLLATLLSMIGLYGVMAYTVARRTREIGIRMALGAVAGRVTWMILREAAILVGFGLAIGLPLAWGLGRYVGSQLYGVTPTDPSTIIGATLALISVATLAGLLPARRAARINPIKALREE